MHPVGVEPKILSVVSHSFGALKHLTERAWKNLYILDTWKLWYWIDFCL